jgi:hypothetical protein
MIILPELWDFICEINTKGVYEAKKHKQFKLLDNIITFTDNYPIGIPFWSLFENIENVSIVTYSFTKISIIFDEHLNCFIFKNLYDAFFGIKEIFRTIHYELRNEENTNKYNIAKSAINILKNNSEKMDDICDLFNKTKL